MKMDRMELKKKFFVLFNFAGENNEFSNKLKMMLEDVDVREIHAKYLEARGYLQCLKDIGTLSTNLYIEITDMLDDFTRELKRK